MVRKFTALVAALALGGGIAYAQDEGKTDERPSRERGTLQQEEGTTDPTAKPSEKKNDTANQNNDSTNKNDATDNHPRDTREKGGVTDTKEGTSPSNPGTQGSVNPSTTPPANPTAATGTQAAYDLPNLFSRLRAINVYEIKLGILANQKAKNRGVKAYGRTLASDHRKADRELNKIAKKQKVAIEKYEPKTDLERDQVKSQAELEERLKAARGGQFDTMYLTGMVTAHTEAIDLVNGAIEKINDAAVKSFLQKMLPRLQKHRSDAQRLLDKLKAAS